MTGAAALKCVIRSRLSRAVTIGAIALVSTAPAVSAQRLFAREGDGVFELQAGASGFGGVTAALTLPGGCTQPGVYSSPATRVIAGGRYLAWERAGGVCLLDTLNGRMRSLDTSFYTPIVATRTSAFGLVVAEHTVPGIGVTGRERLFLLNAFDDAWHVVDLVDVLPPPTPFASSIWSYDISAGQGELVVIESRTFGNRTTPLMTRLSMATGAVLGTVSIAADVLVSEAALTADGTRAVLLSDDWYGGGDGVFVVRTSTGDVVASSTAVLPHKFGNASQRSLVLDEPANRVLVTVHDQHGSLTATGAAVLNGQTLATIALIDAPRAKAALLPGFVSDPMQYGLLHDPALHVVYMVEHEQQRDRYAYQDIRTELHAIDLTTGAVRRTADMRAVFGTLAGLLTSRVFLLPAPVAPGAPSFTQMGSSVTLQWSASPDASYYVLEAGTAPGLANIGTITTTGPSVTVSGVPPGWYYVRVRAVGIGGAGPRSVDTAVIVP